MKFVIQLTVTEVEHMAKILITSVVWDAITGNMSDAEWSTLVKMTNKMKEYADALEK